MSSVASVAKYPLLLILLLALPQESRGQAGAQLESLVPEGLMDFIPPPCMKELNEAILPCAIEELCFTLLPTDEELESIPDESEIGSCTDIEASLCPITTRCPACKEKADTFFKCIITNNIAEPLSQNVTDLIMSCPLDCDSYDAADIEVPTLTDILPDGLPEVLDEVFGSSVPVASPVAAPDTESSAPFDTTEYAEDATEAPEDSAGAHFTVVTAAILGAVATLAHGL